jgi:SOS-response transcriptional repressor LexA
MSMGLTAKQRDAFDFIARTIAQHGVPPSLSEIRDHLGCRSKSWVHTLLAALKERGCIDFLPNRARSITLLKQDAATAATSVLPPRLRAALAAFCVRHGEDPVSVVADAVALHLDGLEVLGARRSRARPSRRDRAGPA